MPQLPATQLILLLLAILLQDAQGSIRGGSYLDNNPHAEISQTSPEQNLGDDGSWLESAVQEVNDNRRQQHRELGLIDDFCKFIGRFLPGKSTCTCSVSSFGVVDFDCAFNKEVCRYNDPTVFCTTPTLTGKLNILRWRLEGEMCTSEARQGGVNVPGVCGSFGWSFFKNLFGGKNSPELPDDDGVAADSIATLETTGNLESCKILVGNETCYSCEICNSGSGYQFDCSEFDETMVQSKCVPMKGIFDAGELDFLPDLD